MKKRKFAEGMALAFVTLLGLAVFFPVWYGILGAFRAPSEFASGNARLLPESFLHTENFAAVFRRAPIGRYYLNSFATSFAVCVLRLLFAALAAYAFVFFSFRGRKACFLAILATMMIPADTLVVTNYQTISAWRLTDTWIGICLPSLLGAAQMFMLRQVFRSTPSRLRDAALLDGCGDAAFLLRVLLPVCRPVLAALLLQVFTGQWNAYLWPLMATNTDVMRTVQVGITMLTDTEAGNYEVILAGVTVALIPPGLLFAAMQRKLSGGLNAGSLAG